MTKRREQKQEFEIVICFSEDEEPMEITEEVRRRMGDIFADRVHESLPLRRALLRDAERYRDEIRAAKRRKEA